MKVQGTYDFDAPLDTVWRALFDAEILARTLPGCDKLERAGNQFRGDINVKMGPVQGKFQGKVDITDIVERESYTMIVDGRGPAGFGKATASMRVTAQGTGTRLAYDSDVQVGGKIASVGQRLIDASSRAIVKQSLESLHEQIKALATSAPPRAEATTSSGAGPVRAEPALAADGAPAPTMSQSEASQAEALLAEVPQAEAPAVAQPKVPGQPPVVRAPSQASFALGVAKQVTKELFPMRTVLLILGLLVLGWILLRSLSGGAD